MCTKFMTDQKRTSDSLDLNELKLQRVVAIRWVLGTESRASAKRYYRAVSSALMHNFR